jgi:hypothetical protein
MAPRNTGGWPEPRAAAASGAVALNQSTISVNNLPQPALLCSATFPEPTSNVLSVRVNTTGGMAGNAYGRSTYDFVAAGYPADVGKAILMLEYGAGNTRQRAVCDLRSGNYQLPPCEQVRAFVAGYYFIEDIAAWAPDVEVLGTIAPGQHLGASLPTYTSLVQLGAVGAEQVAVPDLAREVDCWCVYNADAGPLIKLTPGGTPPGGTSGSPISAALPQLVRDYANNLWQPPYPARCAGAGQSYYLTASLDCWCAVQFTLEL